MEGCSVAKSYEPRTMKPEAGYVKKWYHTEERINYAKSGAGKGGRTLALLVGNETLYH